MEKKGIRCSYAVLVIILFAALAFVVDYAVIERKMSKCDCPDCSIAGLMLSGIISDTLLLVSPTTTELDKQTVKELSKIAGVDPQVYGLEMLKAGTSLKGKTEEDILFGDFKMYEVNNKKIGVTQVSTFDINDFTDSIEIYKELINKNAKNNSYDVFAFFITDILKNGSYVYYNDNAQDIMASSFQKEDMHQGYYLDGVVSRKKQVIPKIMKALD